MKETTLMTVEIPIENLALLQQSALQHGAALLIVTASDGARVCLKAVSNHKSPGQPRKRARAGATVDAGQDL
jgi:hypothetical protein